MRRGREERVVKRIRTIDDREMIAHGLEYKLLVICRDYSTNKEKFIDSISEYPVFLMLRVFAACSKYYAFQRGSKEENGKSRGEEDWKTNRSSSSSTSRKQKRKERISNRLK